MIGLRVLFQREVRVQKPRTFHNVASRIPKGNEIRAVCGHWRGNLEALEFDVVVDIARIGQVITARGKPVRIRFEIAENVVAKPIAARNNPAEDAAFRDRAMSHPGVKRFQELFPDAQVRTVRNLNE